MLNQLCYLGYSDNRFKMGLEFESLAWYICMFTYLLIFLKFFFCLLPQSTLHTTSSTHTSLYETLGWIIFQPNLEFKGPGNGTEEHGVQRRKEDFPVALGILREVMFWDC